MSLKPIHKRRQLEGREAVWDIIRRLKTFTVRELRDETHLGIDTVRDYVTGLLNAGYLAIQSEAEPFGKAGATYALIRDGGIEPPRVRKDGSEITQGRGRERMWTSMRILKEFSVCEIVATASMEKGAIALEEGKNFIGHLHKAGYLIVVSKSRPGVMARYRLLTSKNTGPRPPIVQRDKSVFDQNQQRVVWSKESV
jgi:hypothetical protein